MGAILTVNPSDAAPIWRQIEDGMRRLAVSGTLRSGAVVPSVREMARDLRVNPATVAKAYQRLSDAGVLVVRRGEGTFVAERSQHEIESDRQGMLVEGARRFAAVARTVQASRNEAVEALCRALDQPDDAAEGGAA